MNLENSFTEKVPTWALCAIVNGDFEGLTDSEIEEMNEATDGLMFLGAVGEYEEYFTHNPMFGLPCMVVDCVFIPLEDA